jgi:hypothetical protein
LTSGRVVVSTRRAFTVVTANEAVAERPDPSDTRIEKANCPAACGVPEMRPADDRESPGGSTPPAICQVWGRWPPVATSAASNPDPTVAAVRTFVSTTSGGTGRVVVVAGGRVVVGADPPPPPDDVVVVGTVVVGGGSTVVAGAVVVGGASTVVVGTVVVGDADWMVVVGTVVSGATVVSVEPTEVVEVGRIVVVGGGAGRVSTSTRCPCGNTCRSTSVTAALAT